MEDRIEFYSWEDLKRDYEKVSQTMSFESFVKAHKPIQEDTDGIYFIDEF